MRAAVVKANRANNPEVFGSNPTPATNTKLRGTAMLSFDFWDNDLIGG